MSKKESLISKKGIFNFQKRICNFQKKNTEILSKNTIKSRKTGSSHFNLTTKKIDD